MAQAVGGHTKPLLRRLCPPASTVDDECELTTGQSFNQSTQKQRGSNRLLVCRGQVVNRCGQVKKVAGYVRIAVLETQGCCEAAVQDYTAFPWQLSDVHRGLESHDSCIVALQTASLCSQMFGFLVLVPVTSHGFANVLGSDLCRLLSVLERYHTTHAPTVLLSMLESIRLAGHPCPSQSTVHVGMHPNTTASIPKPENCAYARTSTSFLSHNCANVHLRTGRSPPSYFIQC